MTESSAKTASQIAGKPSNSTGAKTSVLMNNGCVSGSEFFGCDRESVMYLCQSTEWSFVGVIEESIRFSSPIKFTKSARDIRCSRDEIEISFGPSASANRYESAKIAPI